MTFKWKWTAAAAGVALLGAAMAPWTFSGAAMRQEVARQIRETTGLIAQSDGRAVLALLPRPRIKIENVRIRDREGKLDISAEFLRGDLRILPMFAGRMELVSATLSSPRMAIDLDANPFAEQGAIARAMDAGALPTAAQTPPSAERLGIVSILNGVAHMKSAARQVDLTIANIDMTVDWRTLASPASLKGSFQLLGERAEIAAWIGRPADLLRGKPSDLSLRLDAPALTLNMNGSLGSLQPFHYDGNVTAAAPDLRRLLANAGGILPLPGRLSGASLAGTTRIRSDAAAFSDLRLTIDGNTFEGALAYDGARARPMLSGTLAADLLHLTPFLVDIPDLIEPDGAWSRVRLPIPVLAPLDVDLRISAARARAGRVQLRDAAFSLGVINGRAEVSLGEATAYNGLVKARLTAQRGPTGYDLRASASLVRVDSAALSSEWFRNQRLSGEMSADIALSSEGETLRGVLRALQGDARFTVKSGDIAGLDLEQALRRLEKRPLAIGSEVRNGRTNFETAVLDLRIDKGIAEIKQAQARGPGVEFDVTGAFAIAERGLDLKLQAGQTGLEAAARQSGPWLSMELRGGWDEPQLILDARSLINRSEAAAPLLRGPADAAPASAPEAGPGR